MSTSTYNATITARSDLTPALAFFQVLPDGAPAAFVPGQYFTLGLVSGNKLVQRPYSAASSARRVADGYELFIRLIPGGALTPLLFASRAGDRISIRGPKGRFTLAPGDPRVHLFVATGCGIAPFMSMIRTLRDDAAERPIVLVHGVSYVQELAYRLFLEDLAADRARAFSYVPTISRPAAPENAGWTGSVGRVESVIAGVCERLDLTLRRTVAYVCGNPQMTAGVRGILTARGFDRSQVHTEDYWPL
ncbi:MAG TPA: FAD-binding oxidoreductase [Candidatus Limnocylindria bacterium]|nr:FAD-binding oxidoreductase [Candidatus Limnocylindria bacterium]